MDGSAINSGNSGRSGSSRYYGTRRRGGQVLRRVVPLLQECKHKCVIRSATEVCHNSTVQMISLVILLILILIYPIPLVRLGPEIARGGRKHQAAEEKYQVPLGTAAKNSSVRNETVFFRSFPFFPCCCPPFCVWCLVYVCIFVFAACLWWLER